ncbi:MAG: hypothetical protein AAB305_00890 [Candidatus Zixiibacteriota bacterium]|mgnify:CR=1 FL=1
MRHSIFVAVALVALCVFSAMAGDYHSGATLNCAECHVMHYSQSHDYGTSGAPSTNPLAGGPNHYLLRQEVTNLCLSCHDNQTFAPDVLGATGNAPTNGRLAGALNKIGGIDGYSEVSGHTLGSIATAPGGTFANANGLTCIDCHRQHGSSFNYRNVRTTINTGVTQDSLTYAIGASNNNTKDLWERDATNGGANHYDYTNVDFNEPNTGGSSYGWFCQQCHTDFHGSKTSTNMKANSATLDEWLRHPTADANIGEIGGGHSSATKFAGKAWKVKVMNPNGDWGTYGTANTGVWTGATPSCMSCHKGHGNKNAFGLIFATGNAAIGEDGDVAAPYKVVCGQCHVQQP